MADASQHLRFNRQWQEEDLYAGTTISELSPYYYSIMLQQPVLLLLLIFIITVITRVVPPSTEQILLIQVLLRASFRKVPTQSKISKLLNHL